MSGNCTALKYSRDFSFLNVFRAVGDAVNVYIPCNLVLAEFPPIAESIVFGSRPYSVQSDIVAVTAHMGILFPSEKQKKSSPNFLFTCPHALRLKASDTTTHEDSRRIDDDFRFYGVVVTVIAAPPMDEYPGSPRFNISSQTSTDPGPFSLDIVDYHFVSEFEPAPSLTDNPQRCMFHYDDLNERFYQETDDLDFIYSPQYFKTSSAELLFRDFAITFMVNGERLQFVAEQPNIVMVYKLDNENNRVPLYSQIQLGQIDFGDHMISVAGNRLSPVTKVILTPKMV
ncbi:hypothetical protein TRFO_42196 [Tritrichomonas foetus]|uniref:Uncharacterized protein n=1 Tax=Tritrichomonas foetus TaxID=1144522 RepID=A0A1J4KXE5_9EUKA|nr:hypothetical protein TRFO_42196 [Tritrichomonas foetus]|eukprot:OHT15911.1 hypothetical protein TRFO_42196 [Tritrichomonas foetus]